MDARSKKPRTDDSQQQQTSDARALEHIVNTKDIREYFLKFIDLTTAGRLVSLNRHFKNQMTIPEHHALQLKAKRYLTHILLSANWKQLDRVISINPELMFLKLSINFLGREMNTCVLAYACFVRDRHTKDICKRAINADLLERYNKVVSSHEFTNPCENTVDIDRVNPLSESVILKEDAAYCRFSDLVSKLLNEDSSAKEMTEIEQHLTNQTLLKSSDTTYSLIPYFWVCGLGEVLRNRVRSGALAIAQYRKFQSVRIFAFHTLLPMHMRKQLLARDLPWRKRNVFDESDYPRDFRAVYFDRASLSNIVVDPDSEHESFAAISCSNLLCRGNDGAFATFYDEANLNSNNICEDNLTLLQLYGERNRQFMREKHNITNSIHARVMTRKLTPCEAWYISACKQDGVTPSLTHNKRQNAQSARDYFLQYCASGNNNHLLRFCLYPLSQFSSWLHSIVFQQEMITAEHLAFAATLDIRTLPPKLYKHSISVSDLYLQKNNIRLYQKYGFTFSGYNDDIIGEFIDYLEHFGVNRQNAAELLSTPTKKVASDLYCLFETNLYLFLKKYPKLIHSFFIWASKEANCDFLIAAYKADKDFFASVLSKLTADDPYSTTPGVTWLETFTAKNSISNLRHFFDPASTLLDDLMQAAHADNVGGVTRSCMTKFSLQNNSDSPAAPSMVVVTKLRRLE